MDALIFSNIIVNETFFNEILTKIQLLYLVLLFRRNLKGRQDASAYISSDEVFIFAHSVPISLRRVIAFASMCFFPT